MPTNPYNEYPINLGRVLALVYGIDARPYDTELQLWVKVAASLGASVTPYDDLDAVLSRIADAGGAPPAPPAPVDAPFSWEPASETIDDKIGLIAGSSFNPSLPGITSLSIHHTTNREGYTFYVASQLQSLSFPALVSLTGDGFLDVESSPALASLSVPVLAGAPNIFLIDLAALTALNFPELVSVSGDLFLADNVSAASAAFPKLEDVGGDFAILFHVSLTSLSLPALTSAGRLILNGNTLVTTASFPSLESLVGGQSRLEGHSALAAFSLPSLTSVFNLLILDNANLVSVSLPLATVGSLSCQDNASLSSVDLSNFTGDGSSSIEFTNNDAAGFLLNFPAASSLLGLSIVGNAGLTSVSFPVLTTFSGATFGMNTNASLTTVSIPSLVFVNGKTYTWNSCALLAASVNAILAQAVASAAFTSGSLLLDGGTNAAPSGQGIVDKATLLGRGVTVTTN